MKFDIRKSEDTSLDALIARIYDAPDAATKDAARAALRGANPGTVADDLAAAIGSLVIVPRSEGPPTRPDVGSSRTAAAHEIAVILRALEDLVAAANVAVDGAEQADGARGALLQFQHEPDSNRSQFIPAVEQFAHTVEQRAQRARRRRKELDVMLARFHAELASLADALP